MSVGGCILFFLGSDEVSAVEQGLPDWTTKKTPKRQFDGASSPLQVRGILHCDQQDSSGG